MQRPSAGVRPRPRIETLADLVFGLSLSIGSIALIANPPKSAGEITTHILAFAYTFFCAHHRVADLYDVHVRLACRDTDCNIPQRRASPPSSDCSLLVEWCGSGNPALTSDEISMIQNYSSTLFALDLGGILLILATFAHVISLEEKMLVAPELVTLFRRGRNRMAILAVLTLISVAPGFWEWKLLGIPIRLYLWYPPLISYWVGRAVRPDSRTYKLA